MTPRERLLQQLHRRDRFRAELRAAVSELDDDDFETLVRQLGELIDDRRPLDAYLCANEGQRAKGRPRMREELTARGCPPDLLETALSALPPEEERARDVIGNDRTPRAARRLMARGFDEETVAALFPRDRDFTMES